MKNMKILVVEPDKKPYLKEIPDTLEAKQQIVGGNIEAYYPFDDMVCIVCNEEGKINGMPLNRAIYDNDKNIIEIMAGTFFVCGLTRDDFGSIPDKLIDKYSEMFKYPEHFMMMGNRIVAVPIKHVSISDYLKDNKTAEPSKKTPKRDSFER